jgi:hypothetical protein
MYGAVETRRASTCRTSPAKLTVAPTFVSAAGSVGVRSADIALRASDAVLRPRGCAASSLTANARSTAACGAAATIDCDVARVWKPIVCSAVAAVATSCADGPYAVRNSVGVRKRW